MMGSTVEAPRETAAKAVFAAIGAPVVAGRKLRELGTRLVKDLAGETGAWEAEGRKLTGQIQESKVVEQVQSRVDVDQLQEQVERFRDQLESVLANWRKGFRPVTAAERDTTSTAPVDGRAARTSPAKKPAGKQTTTPQAKKTQAKKTQAAKPAAKRPGAKKPTE